MLKIHIPETEAYSSEYNRFINVKAVDVNLEHSLISISKWEAKYHKPFLDNKNEKTGQELIDYIRFMSLSSNIDPNVFAVIPRDELDRILEYIKDPQSATTFSDEKTGRASREIITSELIYYWMVALQIPFECQKWHINRLLTLIKICNIKNNPDKKKMSTSEIYAQNKMLNAKRRAKLHSKG
jgi:hypothetical protein